MMSKYINNGHVGFFGNVFSSRNNSVNINGVKISVPNGSSISSVNGEIYIDGKKYEGEELNNKEAVYVVIEGNVSNVTSDRDVIVKEDVTGDIRSNRDVEVGGNVNGNISAGRDVEINNDVIGNISAGRDVEVEGNYIDK